jgi:2'-5' RNA ligase
MDGWQPWQREYRFGVVLIYPPEPVRAVLNTLRAEHDPRSQRYSDAHISLSVAAPSAPSEEQWAALQSELAEQPPVSIKYGPLKTFEGHPGVVLHVEPRPELDRLRAIVESAPPFSAAAPRRWPFSPHLTIAEFISLERSAELMVELRELDLQGEFSCSHLVHAVPDESFHFEAHRSFLLGGKRA